MLDLNIQLVGIDTPLAGFGFVTVFLYWHTP